MKTRLSIITFTVLVLAFSSVFSTGCGDETEKASDIARSVQTSIDSAQEKNTQATNLITQAVNQMSASQGDQVKTSLMQAQDLANQIKTELTNSKSQIDQAASMDITSEYRSYLQAKSKSVESSIAVNATDQEMINIWLSDPLMDKPDTLQKITELQTMEVQQEAAATAAEAEAEAIANANPNKIR